MTLSVVVVSWNTRELLKQCLTTLYTELNQHNIIAEVIVVDNNSADGSADLVRAQFPQATLIANGDNKGFGRANNQAFAIAQGEYVLLLNPDTEVIPNAIKTLLEFMGQHPQAGIVAPQLINCDGSIQRSCREFPTLSNMFYELSGLSRLFPKVNRFRRYKMLDFAHTTAKEVDQPEGACLLIRCRVLDKVGWFDEKFFMLFEEVDLCYRVKKSGWQIWFTPEAKIIHHFGQSIKQVKAKIIFHSHKGMYYFWSKYRQQWYYQIIKPVLWIGLMFLAIIRAITYKIKYLL